MKKTIIKMLTKYFLRGVARIEAMPHSTPQEIEARDAVDQKYQDRFLRLPQHIQDAIVKTCNQMA